MRFLHVNSLPRSILVYNFEVQIARVGDKKLVMNPHPCKHSLRTQTNNQMILIEIQRAGSPMSGFQLTLGFFLKSWELLIFHSVWGKYWLKPEIFSNFSRISSKQLKTSGFQQHSLKMFYFILFSNFPKLIKHQSRSGNWVVSYFRLVHGFTVEELMLI